MARINKTKVGSEYRVRTKGGKIMGEFNRLRQALRQKRNVQRNRPKGGNPPQKRPV